MTLTPRFRRLKVPGPSCRFFEVECIDRVLTCNLVRAEVAARPSGVVGFIQEHMGEARRLHRRADGGRYRRVSLQGSRRFTAGERASRWWSSGGRAGDDHDGTNGPHLTQRRGILTDMSGGPSFSERGVEH